MTAISDHPEIDAWLADPAHRILPHPLFDISPAPTQFHVDKMGMLPLFVRGETIKALLAEPRPTNPDKLGYPGFQIPKGTQQYWDAVTGAWEDVNRYGHDAANFTAESIIEPPAYTALRESIEEVGTRLSNIGPVYDIGVVAMRSMKNKDEMKYVHLFIALMRNQEDFDVPSPAVTTATRWWDISPEMQVKNEGETRHFIREDHAAVLAKLAAHMARLPGAG